MFWAGMKMNYTKLKYVAKYPTGKLNSNAAVEDGQYPFFTCAHEVYRIDKYAYDGEYVLLGGNNASGDFPIFYYNGKFEAYQRTYLIQPLDTKKYDTHFLYYAIGLKLELMKGNASGTATKFLTQPILNNITIENWNIEYQKKIVDILSRYDQAIENNNKRIKILEQMAENLYKEWFVRFRFPGHENVEFEDGKPINWEILRLEDFGIDLESGSRPSGGIDDAIEDGVPSLGAEAVNGLAEFDYSSVKLVPYEFYEKLKRGKNKGNHILVYKDGAYIGKVTIFRNEFPYKEYAINEHVFFLNSVDTDYQNYLYFTLHQDAYFTTMQNLNRNAAQPGLSKPDMNRIKITVPDKKTVLAFNEFVEPVFDEVFKLAKSNKILIKQRDLLLPRLMSGKLEVK